jgi:RHS repeat-associated protein
VKRLVGQAGEVWQVYSPDGELLAEYPKQGAAATPTKEYGYRGGQLLVVFDSTEVAADDKLKWLVQDHLGSTRMIVNKSGSLAGIKRRDYLPFGEELAATVGHRAASGSGYQMDDKPRQKFGDGYERDDETGLDYAKARYLSSVQGRFTCPDPLMASAMVIEPQSWNRYSFVGNRPLFYRDPTGEIWATNKNGELVWFYSDRLSEDDIKAGWQAVVADSKGRYIYTVGDTSYELNPNGPNENGGNSYERDGFRIVAETTITERDPGGTGMVLLCSRVANSCYAARDCEIDLTHEQDRV